ncbi:hypothetical protein ACTXT7_004954 [Hymenolepis weldensis]
MSRAALRNQRVFIDLIIEFGLHVGLTTSIHLFLQRLRSSYLLHEGVYQLVDHIWVRGYRSATRTYRLMPPLSVSDFHSPHNPKGLDEQLVKNVERQLLVSNKEGTVEEILNYLHFRFRSTRHSDIQIWVRHCKILCSRNATLTSRPKMDPTAIYVDACYLPPLRNPETPETQHNRRSDRHSTPTLRFEVKGKHNIFQMEN